MAHMGGSASAEIDAPMAAVCADRAEVWSLHD